MAQNGYDRVAKTWRFDSVTALSPHRLSENASQSPWVCEGGHWDWAHVSVPGPRYMVAFRRGPWDQWHRQGTIAGPPSKVTYCFCFFVLLKMLTVSVHSTSDSY